MPGSDARKSIRGSDAASQEAKESQSADAGQSPSVASLAYGEASSGYAGQKEPSLGSGYRVRVRKIGCEAKERFTRNGLLRSGYEYRVVEAGYKNRVLKNKMLNQVHTNL